MYQDFNSVLSQVKTSQKAQLKQSCVELTMYGQVMAYTDLDGNIQSLHIGGGEQVALLLQGLAGACKRLDINYTMSDAITHEAHTMSADEGVRLSDEALLFGSSLWKIKNTKQNLVDACTSVEAVLAITWDSEEVA